MIPAGSPSIDAGAAGHLAAGIVDMVLGLDWGVPHDVDGMQLELAVRRLERGRHVGPGAASRQGERETGRRMKTFDGDRGNAPGNDSSQINRSGVRK